MNRDEYLYALRENLTTKTHDEKDEIVRNYLQQMINSGNEQALMAEWGKPEALADKICGTNNFHGDPRYYMDVEEEYVAPKQKKNSSDEKSGGFGLLKLLFLIFCIPFIGSFYVTMVSLFIAGIAISVAGVACGIMGVVGSLGFVPNILFSVGLALTLCGIGSLFTRGTVWLMSMATKGIKTVFK